MSGTTTVKADAGTAVTKNRSRLRTALLTGFGLGLLTFALTRNAEIVAIAAVLGCFVPSYWRALMGRNGWKVAAVSVFGVLALLQFLDRDLTEQMARGALRSELIDSGSKGWEVRKAAVPVFTLLNATNEVRFVLVNGERTRMFTVTVYGLCLSHCTATWNRLQSWGL